MVKIVYLSFDNTAGVPQNLVDGFNALGHEAKLVCAAGNYLDYPTSNFLAVIGNETAQQWVDESQVVIVNAGYNSQEHSMRDCKLIIPQDKLTVRVGHGTYERKGRPTGKGWNLKVVTTPDLLQLSSMKDAIWMPQPLNVDEERYKMVDSFPTGTIYISHTPTKPKIKGTVEFKQAITKLQEEGFDIQPLLIQNMTNAQALQERRKAAFHFDQNRLGVYGVSAVEGLLLGQKVLVGISRANQPAVRELGTTPSPFINTNPLGIYETLKRELIGYTADVNSLQAARDWACQAHDGKVAARQILQELGL